MIFQPINDAQHSLDGRIVTYIRELVERGELVPGDRLPPERELATQLGVSRTALREALHTLAAQGLVDLQHGRGVFITAGSAQAAAQRLSQSLGTDDSPARLHDLFEIRRTLEGAAAEWATQRATDSQITELRALLAKAAPICDTEPIDATQAGVFDARFHALVAASTGNRTLMHLMAALVDELTAARSKSLAIPGRARRSFYQHIAVVDAIEARDPVAARARMLKHLNDVEQSILSMEQFKSQSTPYGTDHGDHLPTQH
jgi:GntR family transcriptional repressor for pyruvate dehydrogenase complex